MPKSLFLIQEGIISLNMQCTLIQLNEIIKKLYVQLITNKYFSEYLNQKIITKQTINTIKNYGNDHILKNLKLHNQAFIEEIKKVRNFQLSIVSKDEIIGLEEIFFHMPYYMNGVVISEKCIYYELPIENLDNLIQIEGNVEELYIKTSVNKLLSLIERLQNLKKSIIDFNKNKYDKYLDENGIRNSQIAKTEINNEEKNKLININNNIENDNLADKKYIENKNMKTEDNLISFDENKNNNNTINSESIFYHKFNYKLKKKDFLLLKKKKSIIIFLKI